MCSADIYGRNLITNGQKLSPEKMDAKRNLQLELASIVKSALRNADPASGIPPEPLSELVMFLYLFYVDPFPL